MRKVDASANLKCKVLQHFSSYVIGEGRGFGKQVGDRIQITDLHFCLKEMKAVTICEIEVGKDMLDVREDALHASCSAYLIDMCTALPFIVLKLAQEEQHSPQPSIFAMAPYAPSQRLDITYHHPAPLASRLRITTKSLSHDGRSLTIRGNIWDTILHRLVVSATHNKIMPKSPPDAAYKL
ncbi:hypothetical protein K439DRAFT_1628645 [Ramaria rubella]|nr:hypothetical protein K439DRAFT_1628645 [Ramaria rubella]